MALKTRELFRERVLANGGFRRVAKTLGCSRQLLYAFATTNGPKPGRERANAIKMLLGISADAWDHIDGEAIKAAS